MDDATSAGSFDQIVRDAAPAALAVLVRQGASFADAEDAVQDAIILAAETWGRSGTPDRPVGWVVRVAQRRLIARFRTDVARQRREAVVSSWSVRAEAPAATADDELMVLFLCCSPALTPTAAIPLTLRAVGGLSTRDIADALLQSEQTIAQRISRAKATVGQAEEPFRAPTPALLAERLPAVMQVIYLIFNEGYAASSGTRLVRTDLAEEAIRLARQLHRQVPDHPEVAGLLALLLLTDARRSARTSADGAVIPLDQQDRRSWNRSMITDGLTVLTAALGHHELGDYQIQAAIAAVHDQAASYRTTDWATIRTLYDRLLESGDNPMVRLSRAVAVAHVDGVEAGRAELEALAAPLAANHRYHATVGYLHELSGDDASARVAYAEAAALATNDPVRRYLEHKAAPGRLTAF